jgi:hypothetical protein
VFRHIKDVVCVSSRFAEKTYHDSISKLETRDTRHSMAVMCNNDRDSLGNCRDRIRKASDILGLDITHNRTGSGQTVSPASPGAGRE